MNGIGSMSKVCLKRGIDMGEKKENCNNKTQRNFTLRKFLHTGRELIVEIRGSLHTSRGKWGVALFLFGVFIGIHKALTGEELDEKQSNLFLATLWSTAGLGILSNLQNYKLLYLLPISRKEFAAAQMRKTAWICIIIFGVITAQLACMGLGMENFWRDVFWKGIPVSASLGAYPIGSVRPIKGSEMVGTKMYGLSFWIVILDLGIAFLNLMFMVDSWSIYAWILSILNYGACICAAVYFYRKIAFTDLYYDEL